MSTNKLLWIVGGVIVLAVLFFVFQAISQTNTGESAAGTETSQNEQEGTEDVSAGSVNVGSQAAPVSYMQALTRYANFRIQFSTAYNACVANPNSITYKDNTGIMLDNRSPNTKTIKIDQTYTVRPWSFKIIILPDTYRASKTFLVDCDRTQNVATILVQE